MKSTFFKMLSIIFGMVMSISLISCGDDDEDNNDASTTQKTSTVTVDYSVSLSEAYYECWDIQVSYTNAGGQTITETIDNDWSLQLNMNASDEIPTKYALTVTGKPKTEAPTLDDEQVYTLSKEYGLAIKCLSSSGATVGYSGTLIPNSSNLSVKGSDLASLVTQDYSICNLGYEITIE